MDNEKDEKVLLIDIILSIEQYVSNTLKQSLQLNNIEDISILKLNNILKQMLLSITIDIDNDIINKIEAYIKYDNNKSNNITSLLNISSFAMINETSLCIWKGDITKIRIDAIVNPVSNSNLLGCNILDHSCLDRLIHTRAGPRLKITCKKISSISSHKLFQVGDARITEGYCLPCDFVLHSLTPNDNEFSNDSVIKLINCYKNCLNLAKDYNLKSIALCCMSVGKYGFSSKAAARIALETVKEWLIIPDNSKCLHTIVFTTNMNSDYEAYSNLGSSIMKEYLSGEPLKTFNHDEINEDIDKRQSTRRKLNALVRNTFHYPHQIDPNEDDEMQADTITTNIDIDASRSKVNEDWLALSLQSGSRIRDAYVSIVGPKSENDQKYEADNGSIYLTKLFDIYKYEGDASNVLLKSINSIKIVLKLKAYIARIRYRRQKRSAIVIQSNFRMHRCHRNYKKVIIIIRRAIIKMQAIIRMIISRVKYHYNKRQIVLLQSWVRMLLVRILFLQMKNSNNKIIAFRRGYIQAKKYKRIRNNTILIQTKWKAHIATKNYKKMLIAIVRIQLAMKKYWKMKKLIKASIVIGSFFRGFLIRRRMSKLKKLVKKIQIKWRDTVLMKLIEIYSVNKIIAVWRMSQVRRIFKSLIPMIREQQEKVKALTEERSPNRKKSVQIKDKSLKGDNLKRAKISVDVNFSAPRRPSQATKSAAKKNLINQHRASVIGSQKSSMGTEVSKEVGEVKAGKLSLLFDDAEVEPQGPEQSSPKPKLSVAPQKRSSTIDIKNDDAIKKKPEKRPTIKVPVFTISSPSTSSLSPLVTPEKRSSVTEQLRQAGIQAELEFEAKKLKDLREAAKEEQQLLEQIRAQKELELKEIQVAKEKFLKQKVKEQRELKAAREKIAKGELDLEQHEKLDMIRELQRLEDEEENEKRRYEEKIKAEEYRQSFLKRIEEEREKARDEEKKKAEKERQELLRRLEEEREKANNEQLQLMIEEEERLEKLKKMDEERQKIRLIEKEKAEYDRLELLKRIEEEKEKAEQQRLEAQQELLQAMMVEEQRLNEFKLKEEERERIRLIEKQKAEQDRQELLTRIEEEKEKAEQQRLEAQSKENARLADLKKLEEENERALQEEKRKAEQERHELLSCLEEEKEKARLVRQEIRLAEEFRLQEAVRVDEEREKIRKELMSKAEEERLALLKLIEAEKEKASKEHLELQLAENNRKKQEEEKDKIREQERRKAEEEIFELLRHIEKSKEKAKQDQLDSLLAEERRIQELKRIEDQKEIILRKQRETAEIERLELLKQHEQEKLIARKELMELLESEKQRLEELKVLEEEKGKSYLEDKLRAEKEIIELLHRMEEEKERVREEERCEAERKRFELLKRLQEDKQKARAKEMENLEIERRRLEELKLIQEERDKHMQQEILKAEEVRVNLLSRINQEKEKSQLERLEAETLAQERQLQLQKIQNDSIEAIQNEKIKAEEAKLEFLRRIEEEREKVRQEQLAILMIEKTRLEAQQQIQVELEKSREEERIAMEIERLELLKRIEIEKEKARQEEEFKRLELLQKIEEEKELARKQQHEGTAFISILTVI